MPSVVEIVNRALISIGSSPIIDLAQAGKAAESAAAIWPQVRDDVLRSHPWNSCKSRQTIAELGTAPVFGWAHQYQLPADCLRVIAVNGQSWPTDGWEIEGRVVLTHEGSPLELEYIRREEDANVYDAELVTALAARLAAELATALSALGSISDRAERRAELAVMKARITDGIEEELVEDDLNDSWLAVRF